MHGAIVPAHTKFSITQPDHIIGAVLSSWNLRSWNLYYTGSRTDSLYAARGIFGILRRNISAACYVMPNHINNASRVPLFSGENGPAGDEPFISIIIPFLLEIYLGEENQDTIRLQTRNKSYRQEINRGEAVIICN